MDNSFTDILEKRGYKVSSKKLGGGYVNDVRLITAKKGEEVLEYVLKKYQSDIDMKSMLRGYDLISSSIKTPTIVYLNKQKKEVAYDLIRGKSLNEMIESGDKEAPKAVRKLAQEIEKLHKSKEFNPLYHRNDSPDETKINKHSAVTFLKGNIDRVELDKIYSWVKAYKPKSKRIIHGDAHLGNFLYSNGEIYLIDPDSVKISDHNADLGKIVHSIEKLHHEGKIGEKESHSLRELFLETYQGEDPEGVNLHRLRTPLIEAKGNQISTAIHRIRKILHGTLEHRIAAVSIMTLSSSILINSTKITGNVIATNSNYLNISSLILFLIGIISGALYFQLKAKN